ncbi:hypothetical protein MMB17_02940 [Methylobacterium organophilum]|uniref:glycosyl transferase family 90 n=1 Tax=Methylobacterium organophilum TaxID=410 RepID=UPI001F12A86D|nr:glycosyl transferase family 90 [Methylobacterium organophilum]UMY18321.1 hypothetical protein MMB17_02940 [Methylobacterium organophilum]
MSRYSSDKEFGSYEVQQLFRGLLKRDPESEETIQCHLKFGSIEKAADFIITSQEFRNNQNAKYKNDLRVQLSQLVRAQLAAWTQAEINVSDYAAHISGCRQILNKFVFFCEGNTVRLLDKDDGACINKERAMFYLELLKEVLSVYPINSGIYIIIDVDDEAPQSENMPVFSFQKPRGGKNILLPDFDMFGHNFLNIKYDDVPYESKQPLAIFAGATTGAKVIDLNTAQNSLTQRLRSAKYFRDEPLVDYRLPKICQCQNDDVFDYLLSQGYGRDPVGWNEMLNNKFIISVDGNGATCGRVALALKSNSCLVKYSSNNILYYFDALIPYLHYLPVEKDEDLVPFVRNEIEKPNLYKYVATSGTDFANFMLNKDAVLLYTSLLLEAFKEILANNGIFWNGRKSIDL